MNFWEKNIQQRKGHTHQLPDVGPAWNVGERKVHRGVQTEQGERHIVRFFSSSGSHTYSISKCFKELS